MINFSVHLKSSGRSVSLHVFLPLLFLPVVLTGQTAQQIVVPLKNWAAPLYWQPNHVERETAGKTGPGIRPMVTDVSTGALTLVAITPCRLVDTRGVPAGFNGLSPFSGPSFAPSSTVTFPVQSAAEATADTTPTPCGMIPSIAQAYSFNITVIPKTSGGIAFLSIWPAGTSQPAVSTINDGQGEILANAAIVPAGTPSGGVSVFNSGPAAMDLIIDMNGFYAPPAVGAAANGNTGVGVFALYSNTTGDGNTALGYQALVSNQGGGANTAFGTNALFSNISGVSNTANGDAALYTNNGNYNSAVGNQALYSNSGGSSNVAIGYQAGYNITGSNNIEISNSGTSGDSGVIRIGTSGTQTSFFAAGINNSTVSGAAVVIDATTGQLGIATSSRRYKEDIEDMGEASGDLMRLRPVTFRYKKPFADGSKPVQYGLIAEEVAEVYPDLVAHTADGAIETVKYQVLDSMLLNEVQRQQTEIRGLEQQNRSLQERLEKLETALSSISGASRGASVPAIAAPVVP